MKFRNFVEDYINSKPFFALSPHPWIILFDIDGTLLSVNGSYNRTHLRRILDELGIDYPDMENDSFSGRTDHDIFTSFLVNHDFDEELYQQYKSLYLDYLQNVLLKKKEMVTRLPHIDEALEYFFDGDFICGLLTGNYPQAAQIKLQAADIKRDFSFGAFGELEKDRNKLPRIAMDQFHKLYDTKPDPSRFIILGDTPRDVECANKAGMKCVAVTTGNYSRDELSEHRPDLIIDNLANPDQWFGKVAAAD
ncbi:HAD family hydrolase [Gracilimonas sediminicola]|uniref:phosphoglycolate phosphatase n=1 Tax=Gracilimonas sediminicola TaxID=2952158 RepID=A0A9X2L252_9BACT|nr:HAD hydrolase-like protein [Gracilimonas sediminicola]MCP9290926.1 HAD hydrolase-like protein [Gracilimonas sediminicola]